MVSIPASYIHLFRMYIYALRLELTRKLLTFLCIYSIVAACIQRLPVPSEIRSVLDVTAFGHHLFTDDKQAYASTTLEGVDDVTVVYSIHDCTTDIGN